LAVWFGVAGQCATFADARGYLVSCGTATAFALLGYFSPKRRVRYASLAFAGVLAWEAWVGIRHKVGW
jgi:hypothetical protein